MTVCTKYTRVVCPFDIEKTITLSYYDNIMLNLTEDVSIGD